MIVRPWSPLTRGPIRRPGALLFCRTGQLAACPFDRRVDYGASGNTVKPPDEPGPDNGLPRPEFGSPPIEPRPHFA